MKKLIASMVIAFLCVFGAAFYLNVCFGVSCALQIARKIQNSIYEIDKDTCYNFGYPKLAPSARGSIFKSVALFYMEASYSLSEQKFLIFYKNDRLYIVSDASLLDHHWKENGCGARFALVSNSLVQIED